MSARNTPHHCPQCRTPVPAGVSEGLCPRCLLLGGISWQDTPPPEVELPPEELPRRFQDYELEVRLAEGGMGVVYRARHVSLGRTVALKMIRAGHIAGAEELRRFRQEARAAAQLAHPHVVPVYEVGECGGIHFFTMKLAAGGCLTVPAPGVPAEAAALTAKVARAVHYAHQHGVLHRDLKPSNILLEASGEPMVGDFGLAHVAQGGPDITLSGAVVGTPAYMAPEQAKGQCTTASDVYSLGAVLYAQLAGGAPFSGWSHFEVMRRVVEEEPKALTLPSSARDLAAICQKCMQKNPAARYASAESLAEDLERWLRGEPVEARPAGQAEKFWKWARRRPAQAALLAVSTLGVAGFVAFNIVSERRLRDERNYAQQQEGRARNAAEQASASESAARLQLYAADVFLADSALADGDYGLARAALQAHLPQEGQPDLRGFEWYCLHRICEGDNVVELKGHTSAVNAVAFMPDGKRIVSGSRDGRVLVHDVESGAVVLSLPSERERTRNFTEHTNLTPVLLRSPVAARLLVSALGENYNELFQRARPSSAGDVRAVAVSPDGAHIAAGSQWNWMRVWDTGSSELNWVHPTVDCRCLAFGAGGTRLILGDVGDRSGTGPTVSFVDSVRHEVVLCLDNVTGCFALTGDGNTLAVPTRDRNMEFRDASTGAVRTSWPTGCEVHQVSISANGERLAGISDNPRTMYLWTKDGQRSRPLSTGYTIFRATSLSPDGSLLATAGADHAVHLWNAGNSTLQFVLRGHNDEVLTTAFAPGGLRLVTGCRDQLVRYYDLTKLEPPDRGIKADSPVLISGEMVVENDSSGNVRIGSVTSAARESLPEGKARSVAGALPGGRGIATWTRGARELEFWKYDGSPLSPAITVPGDGEIRSAAMTSDGTTVAVAGAAKSLIYVSVPEGREPRRIALPWTASRVQFSPDGKLTLLYSWPSNFAVLQTATGELLSQWRITGAEIGPVAFSPDAAMVAVGGTDNIVSIYDPRTGQRLTTLRGHKSDIKAAAFSPDGKTLATSSDSRTLKLWHVQTWRELATLSREGVFSFLQFTPENDCLYGWDYGKNLHRFRAPRPAGEVKR